MASFSKKPQRGPAMLLMKKVFFEAIRAGIKRTTLRYWRHPRVRAGSVHAVRGLGRVRILDIRAVEWADLTDDDARNDGLADLNALRTALHAMYPPNKRHGRQLYRIHFRLLR